MGVHEFQAMGDCDELERYVGKWMRYKNFIGRLQGKGEKELDERHVKAGDGRVEERALRASAIL